MQRGGGKNKMSANTTKIPIGIKYRSCMNCIHYRVCGMYTAYTHKAEESTPPNLTGLYRGNIQETIKILLGSNCEYFK